MFDLFEIADYLGYFVDLWVARTLRNFVFAMLRLGSVRIETTFNVSMVAGRLNVRHASVAFYTLKAAQALSIL